MFLKSIEIRGFKSFADKTEVTFNRGITSIVGPNGSGKSNISDAVRWVLGEQSVKALRGGKMEDVIFAGTQYRKPIGLAQVSITLDNTDKELSLEYSLITISRRLYRSGESEYYINNTQCRLKDVQELFMDTGIGRDGYSIIGQGKIEAILSSKPEERRSLLEEAAGIGKFKSRKEEAEKKLELTQQNIVRLSDIINTYEERLEPLRIESEKAKNFIALSEELKSKEINIIIYNIEKNKEKIEQCNCNLSLAKHEFENIKNDYLVCKLTVETLTKEIDECEKKTSLDNKKYYELKEERQNKISDIAIFNERLKNLHINIEKVENNLKSENDKIDLLVISKNKLENEFKGILSTKGVLKSNIAQKENELHEFSSRIQENEGLIKSLKDDQIEFLSRISNINNTISLMINNKDINDSKLSELKESIGTYSNSIKTNTHTQYLINEKAKVLIEKIDDLKKEIELKRKDLFSVNNLIIKNEKELKELTYSLNKYEVNYNVLLNLDKQLEGYNVSVKRLLNDINSNKTFFNDDLSKSCFLFGEIISVQNGYETAFEIALGSSISNIITDNESIAKLLINHLKEKKLGRATFLPLTTIQPKKINNLAAFNKIEGFLGIANELLNFDIKFKNAVDYVLGRTIICTDMDCALRIAKVCNYNYKIVTLSGEVVNPGGSLTGGSTYNKSSNVIGRKREIIELKGKIDKSQLQIDALSSKIDDTKLNAKKTDDMILNYKDEIYKENIEIAKYTEKTNSIIKENKKLEETVTIYSNEFRSLEDNSNKYILDINTEKEAVEKLKETSYENETKIYKIEDLIKKDINNISSKRDKLTNLKIEKAKVDEVAFTKKSDIDNLDKSIMELDSRNDNYRNELKSYLNEKESTELSIYDDNTLLNIINSSIIDMDAIQKKNEFHKLTLKGKINKTNSDLEHYSLIISEKENNVHKLELISTRLEAESDTQLLKLNDELNLTYAQALKYRVETFVLDEFKIQVNEYKNQIAQLGVVNLGAVEEYKDISSKYKFLSSQKDDLQNAKEELLKVIKEMTQKMRVLFKDSFKILRYNFNETFKELFKGGNADLVLENGDELNGTIDITVQPPGKKLQNISLMSGGEKGLAAIALLFAILKMKPSPFCLLDEIEAALDDANVKRYSDYLKKFSDTIQFIVITHRKGTMEASDALYGVTMEEKGISKLVSVSLTETED